MKPYTLTLIVDVLATDDSVAEYLGEALRLATLTTKFGGKDSAIIDTLLEVRER